MFGRPQSGSESLDLVLESIELELMDVGRSLCPLSRRLVRLGGSAIASDSPPLVRLRFLNFLHRVADSLGHNVVVLGVLLASNFLALAHACALSSCNKCLSTIRKAWLTCPLLKYINAAVTSPPGESVHTSLFSYTAAFRDRMSVSNSSQTFINRPVWFSRVRLRRRVLHPEGRQTSVMLRPGTVPNSSQAGRWSSTPHASTVSSV